MNAIGGVITPNPPPAMTAPRLLQQIHEAARTRHLSVRTEKAYAYWVRRFVYFPGKRHPSVMGASEIREFLTHLATREHVAASTQNQALSALLFLYRTVLGMKAAGRGWLGAAPQPRVRPDVAGR